MLFVLLGTATPVHGQSPQPEQATDILAVIPDYCWGFVSIRNLRGLDDKLVQLLEQMEVQTFRPVESYIERLNLGPKIESDGSFAVVLMPADSFEQLGTRSLLLFPCSDVESLLSSFPTTKLRNNLWRSELVWGPTYVGRKGSFAVFGSTEEATRAVLDSRKSIRRRFSGDRIKDFANSDACVWVNAKELLSDAAAADWLKRWDQPAGGSSFFGTESIFTFDSRFLRQIDSVYLGLDLDRVRLKLKAILQVSKGSTLSRLLACTPPGEEPILSVLPKQPFVFAAGGELTSQQAKTRAEELDKFFQSETIGNAIDPERLRQFREELKRLVSSVRGCAWGLTSLPEGPSGVVGVSAVMKVADAQAWLSGIQTSASLLQDGFFINPDANPYYRSIRYLAEAESIDGVKVDHLVVELIDASHHAEAEGLDYSAAFGTSSHVVRLAKLDASTVVVCLGGQRAEVGRLLAAAGSPTEGLTQYVGFAKIRPFLPKKRNALLFFSFEEALRVGRTLARMQDKVEHFPYRMPRLDAPVAAALVGQGTTCHLDVVLPVDLVVGLKDVLALMQTERYEVQAPPGGN